VPTPLHLHRTDESGESIRAAHLDLQKTASDLFGTKKLHDCGRTPAMGKTAVVKLRISTNTARLANVQHCKLTRVCAPCAQWQQQRYRKQMEELVSGHLAGGGYAYLATFTLAHHAGDRLDKLLDALPRGWRSVTNGGSWLADRRRFGVLTQIRVIEVLHGDNGWHPHLHAVLLTGSALDATQLAALQQRMHGRWSRGIAPFVAHRGKGVRLSLEAVSDPKGLANYLTKELSEALLPPSVRGSRLTFFGLLAKFQSTGEAALERPMREYERATRGRKFYLIPNRPLPAGDHNTQPEPGSGPRPPPAAESTQLEDADDKALFGLPFASLRTLHCNRLVAPLLDAVERGGLARATALLDGWNIAWLPLDCDSREGRAKIPQHPHACWPVTPPKRPDSPTTFHAATVPA
jgi:hypothetical protein